MKLDLSTIILLASSTIFARVHSQEIFDITYKDGLKYSSIKVHSNEISSSSIICPEINNATFTDDPPFDILGNPVCGTHIDVKLYTNQDQRGCKLDMIKLPNAKTTECLKMIEEQNPSMDKIVVLIHGFLSNGNSHWILEMKDAIQSIEPRTVVIIVGWGRGLSDLISYTEDASSTRYVAASVFQLMKIFHQTQDEQSIFPWFRKTIYSHCIGHSLGAHVCGLAGKMLNNPLLKSWNWVPWNYQAAVPKWNRISGLDPAGPLFFNDASFFEIHCAQCTEASRLNATDAEIVDVIHTDGDPTYFGGIQYGTLQKAGIVDFYPGTKSRGYGRYQPGCHDSNDVLDACSHSKAHEYYTGSIKNAVCLASRFCGEADPHNFPEKCKRVKIVDGIVGMGYFMTKTDVTAGKYTVEIKEKSPFCAGRP